MRILILVIFIITLAAYCLNNTNQTMNTQNEETLSIIITNLKNDRELDPIDYRFGVQYVYLDNLNIRLVQLDSNGNYEKYLASSIKVSEDKLHYHFTIKDAYFSDGTKITLTDVLKSFKRAILHNTPHTTPKEFIKGADKLTDLDDEIEGLKIIDDKLYIGLNHPVKELFYFLQLADYAILHPNKYNKKEILLSDWYQESSGPYFLQSENNELYFVKNEHFFKDKPHSKAPKRIKPIGMYDKNSYELMKEGKADFGEINFSDFMKYHDKYKELKDYKLVGGKYSSIVHITLNIKSDKFKSNATRQWFNKRVLDFFKVKEDQKAYMAKANQYFLPGAKGYIENENLNTLLDDININEIPSALKNGVIINALETMKPLLPENIDEQLSNSLGISAKVVFDIKREDYLKSLKERKFDATIIMTSMSYKVLAETLNLSYKSKNPTLLDPTGNIDKLLSDYQKEYDNEKEAEIIKSILKQMVIDSECVPVFYGAFPKFYNTKKLSIDDLNLSESIQFWKLNQI